MKTLLRMLLALGLVATMAGCDAFRTLTQSHLKTSQGRAYELLVVCPQPDWEGELGDTLRSILLTPVPYINQTEPLFDLIQINEHGFSGMLADHRNILKVVEDASLDQADISVQYDLSAAPQVILSLQGPNKKSIVAFVSTNRQNFLHVLEKAERDRDIAFAGRFGERTIQDSIKKHFGVRMNIPQGYVLAVSQPDFLWARYEYPSSSLGFFVYSYPYEGPESLSATALIAARNRFAARIPGPANGSYMTTSEVFDPGFRAFRIEERLWCELRGFWDVHGDFMGGPFVSYTTVDTTTNRVFTLDTYVYSPKSHKRNYVRGLEHLFYTIRFPEPAPSPQ